MAHGTASSDTQRRWFDRTRASRVRHRMIMSARRPWRATTRPEWPAAASRATDGERGSRRRARGPTRPFPSASDTVRARAPDRGRSAGSVRTPALAGPATRRGPRHPRAPRAAIRTPTAVSGVRSQHGQRRFGPAIDWCASTTRVSATVMIRCSSSVRCRVKWRSIPLRYTGAAVPSTRSARRREPSGLPRVQRHARSGRRLRPARLVRTVRGAGPSGLPAPRPGERQPQPRDQPDAERADQWQLAPAGPGLRDRTARRGHGRHRRPSHLIAFPDEARSRTSDSNARAACRPGVPAIPPVGLVPAPER